MKKADQFDPIAEYLDSARREGRVSNGFAHLIETTLNRQQLQGAIAAGIISHYLTPERFEEYGVQVAPLVVIPERRGSVRARYHLWNQHRLLLGSSVTKHSITVGRTNDHADWSRVREFTKRTVRFGDHVYAFPLSHTQDDAASQPYLLSSGFIGESLPLTESGKPLISSEKGEGSADGEFLRIWTRPDYSTEGEQLPVVEAFEITANTYYDPNKLFEDIGRIVTATL